MTSDGITYVGALYMRCTFDSLSHITAPQESREAEMMRDDSNEYEALKPVAIG